MIVDSLAVHEILIKIQIPELTKSRIAKVLQYSISTLTKSYSVRGGKR